jgi:hypothetical protein
VFLRVRDSRISVLGDYQQVSRRNPVIFGARSEIGYGRSFDNLRLGIDLGAELVS